MRDETTGAGAGAGAGAERERMGLRAEVEWTLARSLEPATEIPRDDASTADPHDLAEPQARLRQAVAGYTRAMRRQGLPPERVVVLMKQILREAGTGIEPPRRRALTEQATIWCIAAYFEGADAVSPAAPNADGERVE